MKRQRVNVYSFQPFSSRRGLDTVLALRFTYDPELVELLKTAFRDVGASTGRRNLGGWLPDHKLWFCEHVAWPVVRRRLLDAGHTIMGGPREEDGAGNPMPEPPPTRPQLPVDLRAVVKAWYGNLSMRFHPDRGGNNERMLALNIAREELERILRQEGVLQESHR